MRSKKSQADTEAIFWVLISLVLVSAALLSFMWHINSIKENTLPQKKFLARDSALLVNSLHSVPGNIYYWYEPITLTDIELSKFSYMMEDQRFIVKEKGIETSYPYGENTLLDNSLSILEKPSKLEFSKQGNSFVFGKDLSVDYLIQYRKEPIQDKKDVLLVSSLTHDPSTGEEYIEGRSFLQFSSGVKAINMPQINNVDIETSFRLLEQKKGIVIGLKKENNSEEIKIYVSSDNIDHTGYVASLIANNLMESDKSTGLIPIIPVESDKSVILIFMGEKYLSENQDKFIYSISSALEDY